jgi:hypothetical protein
MALILVATAKHILLLYIVCCSKPDAQTYINKRHFAAALSIVVTERSRSLVYGRGLPPVVVHCISTTLCSKIARSDAVPPPHGRSAGQVAKTQGRRSSGARTYTGPGLMHALCGRTSALASFHRGLHGSHCRPDPLQSRQPALVPCPAAASTLSAKRWRNLAPAETRGGPWPRPGVARASRQVHYSSRRAYPSRPRSASAPCALAFKRRLRAP